MLVQQNIDSDSSDWTPGPAFPTYVQSLTLVQQGSGYVLNMTQTNGYIQPATASSTQNFSVLISFSSNTTMINLESLEEVYEAAFPVSSNELTSLPYMNFNLLNTVPVSVYFGLWQVANSVDIFTDITYTFPSSFQPQVDGYIGLGMTNVAWMAENNATLPNFSIYFGNNTAELIFGTDMTKAASPTPIAQIIPFYEPVPGEVDWAFRVFYIQLGDPNPRFAFTPIITTFDMSVNGILMPPAIYANVTSIFCSNYCSSCNTTDLNQVICEISSVSELPMLTFHVEGLFNASTIPISPEFYTLSETINGQVCTVLNFLNDTSNAGWIIIGSQAMSEFYTTYTTGPEDEFYMISLYELISDSEDTDTEVYYDNPANANSSAISQAIASSQALENSDLETQDVDYSDLSDSDGTLSVDLSNATNLTSTIQENYNRVLQLQSMITEIHQASSASNTFTSILNDINQGVNAVEPFLNILGELSGLGPVGSIVGSFLSIFGIGDNSEISSELQDLSKQLTEQIGALSKEVAEVSQEVLEVAQEIANATQAITQMLSVISDDITQVYTSISDMQGQQTAYFETLLDSEEAATCFAQFSNYESTIFGGMTALQLLGSISSNSSNVINGYRTNFLDACELCPSALEGLLNAFNPESEEGGCNLISILINGNATYHNNWQLSIAGSGGYFLTLINMGITLVSALESIQTNSSSAWQIVQSSNNASYQIAVQSLQTALVNCYETYMQDAESNVQQYLLMYNETATLGEVTQLLSLLYPWKAWAVLSLSVPNNIVNPGQNITVYLQTEGPVSIQAFSFERLLGLANNNTQWLYSPAIQSCLLIAEGPVGQICESFSFITTSGFGASQIGTNIIDASGAVYDLTDFSDNGYQTENGLITGLGTFSTNSAGFSQVFYWPIP